MSAASAANAAAVAAAAGHSSSSSSEKGAAQSGLSTIAYSNPRRWYVVYPRYVDVDATIAQGRKVSKKYAVSTPTIPDLLECAQTLQLKVALEDKMYSRDFWQRGRVRIQLRKDDGTWLNEKIQSKKALLIQMGQLIPKLQARPTRLQQLEGMKKQAQQANMPFIMPQFVQINPQAMQRPPQAMAAGAAGAGAGGFPQGFPPGFPQGFPQGIPQGFPPGFPGMPAPSSSPSSSSSSSSSGAPPPESGEGGGGGGKKKKKKGKK